MFGDGSAGNKVHTQRAVSGETVVVDIAGYFFAGDFIAGYFEYRYMVSVTAMSCAIVRIEAG